eukprot:77304_1
MVMYGGCEVMRLSDDQFEITYPVTQHVLQRSKACVHATQLEKKHLGGGGKVNIVPKRKLLAPPKPPAPPSSNQKENNNRKVPPFVSHMRIEDSMPLRDQVGRFLFAAVTEKIHYDGWSHKWDTWSDFCVELHLFAV